jgi:hypothetical protein
MMNVNTPVFITKVKNGFFVYPNALDESEDLSLKGMVFQDFFAMVKFLNGHFPNDRQAELTLEEADRVG